MERSILLQKYIKELDDRYSTKTLLQFKAFPCKKFETQFHASLLMECIYHANIPSFSYDKTKGAIKEGGARKCALIYSWYLYDNE